MKKKGGCMFVDDLLPLLRKVKGLKGDIAEVGVYTGKLFRKLVQFGNENNKAVHAFDSFCGMDSPGKHDGVRYRKGACNSGGLEKFQKDMWINGFQDHNYNTHEGMIPDCFEDNDIPYCFVYIDVDHYQPTVESIEYFHPRIVPGGIIGFDDFYHKKELASRAILEFMDSEYAKEYPGRIKTNNAQIFFIKGGTNDKL